MQNFIIIIFNPFLLKLAIVLRWYAFIGRTCQGEIDIPATGLCETTVFGRIYGPLIGSIWCCGGFIYSFGCGLRLCDRIFWLIIGDRGKRLFEVSCGFICGKNIFEGSCGLGIVPGWNGTYKFGWSDAIGIGCGGEKWG